MYGGAQPATAWYEDHAFLAAFQPFGAANLAASYANLGTGGASWDAAAGSAGPTHDPAVGWSFASASSQYLVVGSGALVSAAPLTIIGLYRVPNFSNYYNIGSIRRTSVSNYGWQLYSTQTSGKPTWESKGASSQGISSTASPSLNTWAVAIGVELATNSRAVYLDGGGKATGATNITPSGLDITLIGAVHNATIYTQFMNGDIAAVGFIDAALDDTQSLALATKLLALVA